MSTTGSGWSKTFRDALAASTWAPRFAVESIEGVGDGTVKYPFVALSTHRRDNYHATMAEAPVFSGGRLTIRTWETSTGSWTFRLADPTFYLRRGTFIAITCGIRNPAGGVLWERIGLAQIQTATRTRDGYTTVTARSVLGALNSRVTTTQAKLDWFSDAGTASELAIAYTVTDTTVTLDSNTDYLLDTTGMVQITPDAGDPFLLTFTGTSGAQELTGCSTAAVLDTTAGAAAINNATVSTARIFRSPAEGLNAFLSGFSNGVSVWPATWHAGYPDEWFDRRDAASWEAAQNNTGGHYRIQAVLTEPQTDGLVWIKAWMAQAGAWPTERQGQITMRCASMPYDYPMPGIYTVDDDWLDGMDVQQYDSELLTSYFSYVTTDSQGDAATKTTTAPRDMPAEKQFDHSMPDLWNNQAAVMVRLHALTNAWVLTTPQRWRMYGVDLRFAQMCLGDTIAYGDRRGMVIALMVDWQRGTAQIDVAFMDPLAPGLR